MDRWKDKIAVVTGASAGIGAVIAIDLIKAGMIVVALARRKERLNQLKEQLDENVRSRFYVRQCDVTDEDQIKEIFKWINAQFNGVHVLVNNAGILKTTELVKPNNTLDIKQTIDTNVMGVMYCTREAFNLMKDKNIDDGHIVNINSIVGHFTPNLDPMPSLNIYAATKYALTSMTEIYRQEFMRNNTKIRVTSVSPGAVATEIFSEEMTEIINQAKIPMLKSEDVSNAVLFAISTPAHVQIHEIVIKPVGEQF